jgi:hypothetical protein
LKRRVRVQPDPDRIVIVPHGGEPLLFAHLDGRLVLEGPWARGPEGSRPPAASLVMLPTGRLLCRSIDLPDAEASQLEIALRLQVDAQQLGSVPAWRTSSIVLPRQPGSEARSGFVIEWPATDAAPSAPRDLPPDGEPMFAGDVACLTALLHAGAAGPLVCVTPDRSMLAFALRVNGNNIIRSARLDAGAWPSAAETTVLESALRSGADAATLQSLLGALREALHAADEGGFGCTASDRQALGMLLDSRQDAEWWRTNGLLVGAAHAWFGPMRALVSLRERPAGERPTRVGDFLNRIGEPQLALRLAVACLIAMAVVPPFVSGARLLLLQWKVGDLAARERAIQSHRERIAMYGEMQRRIWPMGKLIGDLACVTPEGVDWEDVKLSQDRNVIIRGSAHPQDGLNGTEVILKMERQMRDSRIFDRVQKKWDAPDGKGAVAFTMSAVVARPTLRPNYSTDQDFGKKTLAERRYGPEKSDEETPVAEAAPPTAASLPQEPSLGDETAPKAVATDAAHTTPPAEPATGNTTAKSASKVMSSLKGGSRSTGAGKSTGDASADASAASDGATGGRGSRRSASGGGSGAGLAKRSERTPGAADSTVPIPEPLTDEQIAAMTKSQALEAVSKVSQARNSGAVDDDTKKRLKSEFDKLMAKIRAGGGG